MKIEKIHLDDIVRCYCASHIEIDGKLYALFASENPESECYSYTGENFEQKETVWNDRGGCMSIIPFDDRKGEFLAVNEFYLKVSPSLAKIVWGKKTADGWQIQDLFSLPFLHRFDIYHVDGVDYIICATIARNKQNKEDWSLPGQIYVGKLPQDLTEGVQLTQIADGCYRNHGYSRSAYEGRVCGYFSSDQGVLRVEPPKPDGTEWKVTKIIDKPIGEIAFIDIDNDGKDEMMTIEPFHGDAMHIYHENEQGVWEIVFTYPTPIDFAHTLVGRKIAGINSFAGGVRRVNAELFIIQYLNNQYEVKVIEEGVGPANIDVINMPDCDLILSANHTKNEAAVYRITK